MSDQTDVKAYYTTTSGAAGIIVPCRVKLLRYLASGTAGQVTLRDGGATGAIRFTVDTPALATWTDVVPVPGEGIRFNGDVYVTLTNVTSMTFFYG